MNSRPNIFISLYLLEQMIHLCPEQPEIDGCVGGRLLRAFNFGATRHILQIPQISPHRNSGLWVGCPTTWVSISASLLWFLSSDERRKELTLSSPTMWRHNNKAKPLFDHPLSCINLSRCMCEPQTVRSHTL
jgi:hypothetical protein